VAVMKTNTVGLQVVEAIDRALESETAQAATPTLSGGDGVSVIEAIDLHFSILEKIDNLPLQESEALGDGVDLYAHFLVRHFIEAWDPNAKLNGIQHVTKDPDYRKGYKAGWKSAHTGAAQVTPQHIAQLAQTHGQSYAQGYAHGHQISGAAHHVVSAYHAGNPQGANGTAIRHIVAPHMGHLLTAYGHNPNMPEPERGDKFGKKAFAKNMAALDRAGDTVGDWSDREIEPEGGGLPRTGAVRDIEKVVNNVDAKVNAPDDNPEDTTHEHHPADFAEHLRRLVNSHGKGRGEEVVQFGKEGRPDKEQLQKVAQAQGLVTGGRRGRAGAGMRGKGDEAPEGVEGAGGNEYAPGEGAEEREPETPEEAAARGEREKSEKAKQVEKAKALKAGFGAEDQKELDAKAAEERKRGEALAQRRAGRVGASPESPAPSEAPAAPSEKKPEPAAPAGQSAAEQPAAGQDPEHETFKRGVEKHIDENPAFSTNYQGLNVKQALKDMINHPRGFKGRGSQAAAFAKQGLDTNANSKKGHPHTNEIWRARKRIEGVFGNHDMWKKYHSGKQQEDVSIFDALIESSSIFHGLVEDDVEDGGPGDDGSHGDDSEDQMDDQPAVDRGEGDEDYADKKPTQQGESLFDRFLGPSIFDGIVSK
jgi:hypothetical protein